MQFKCAISYVKPKIKNQLSLINIGVFALGVSLIPFFFFNYTNTFFVLYLVVLLIAIFSFQEYKISFNILAPCMVMIASFFFVMFLQVIFLQEINIYVGAFLFSVLILTLQGVNANRFSPGLVLDWFILMLACFIIIEIEIRVFGGSSLTRLFADGMHSVPHYRPDVLRFTAFHGSPLGLAPVCVYTLAREILIKKRTWMIVTIWSLLLLTGSRSSILLATAMQLFFLFTKSGLKQIAFMSAGSVVLFAYSLYANLSFLYTPVIRAAKAFNIYYIFTQDSSVLGRSNTSLVAFMSVFDWVGGIFLGSKNIVTSDAAVASIMQQSGLVYLIIFLFSLGWFFYYFGGFFIFIFYSLFVSLMSLSVGGALAPTPIFVLVLTLLEMKQAKSVKKQAKSVKRTRRLRPV